MWDSGDGEAVFTTTSHTGATVIDAGRMTYST
jgi:autotransporter-associated beta strand protein